MLDEYLKNVEQVQNVPFSQFWNFLSVLFCALCEKNEKDKEQMIIINAD